MGTTLCGDLNECRLVSNFVKTTLTAPIRRRRLELPRMRYYRVHTHTTNRSQWIEYYGYICVMLYCIVWLLGSYSPEVTSNEKL